MINQLLRHFIPDIDQHLSNDRLASLFCDELSFIEGLIARRHLRRCEQCCLRKEDLEGPRADQVLVLYHDALESEDVKLSSKSRSEFERKLDQELQQLSPRRQQTLRIPKISSHQLLPGNPLLAVFGVLAISTACSFVFWWQQRVPNITSNTFLVRAEKWDATYLASGAARGVLYQSIRITASNVTMERSIYRDLEGRRQPRLVKLDVGQEGLKHALMQAGVDWYSPMSATDYQNWHDHQHVRADKIVRAGKHLLKLTTTVPDGTGSAESLTVRDSDFHPVRRTVASQNLGTIEIAELDFKIIPWSAVSGNIFEPSGDSSSHGAGAFARVLRVPESHDITTQEQLDESELDARLVLNQLHADTGEQIELHRRQHEIEIEGVVETDERKRQLQLQLRSVPHVVVSIQSAADLREIPVSAEASTTVESTSMPNRPSALESYLEQRGQSTSDINTLAQRFFGVALTISQESKAIADLETRFRPDAQRTILAEATLDELIYSHRERLEAACKTERELLVYAANDPELLLPSALGTKPSSPLPDAADRNLALSKELTQTNSPVRRSAKEILTDMSVSVDDLTVAAHSLFGKSQEASILNGKK